MALDLFEGLTFRAKAETEAMQSYLPLYLGTSFLWCPPAVPQIKPWEIRDQKMLPCMLSCRRASLSEVMAYLPCSFWTPPYSFLLDHCILESICLNVFLNTLSVLLSYIWKGKQSVCFLLGFFSHGGSPLSCSFSLLYLPCLCPWYFLSPGIVQPFLKLFSISPIAARLKQFICP